MTNLSRALPALILCALPASADPVINEIMFRPGSACPENTALEFIEIHNPDAAPANLSDWAFTKGTDFVIPADGYRVVAANPLGTRHRHRLLLGPARHGDHRGIRSANLPVATSGNPNMYFKVVIAP